MSNLTHIGVHQIIEDLEYLEISTSDLYDYTNKVMQAALLGFSTSVDVDKYPWSFTGMMGCILVKDKEATELDKQFVNALDNLPESEPFELGSKDALAEELKELGKANSTKTTRKTKQ